MTGSRMSDQWLLRRIGLSRRARGRILIALAASAALLVVAGTAAATAPVVQVSAAPSLVNPTVSSATSMVTFSADQGGAYEIRLGGFSCAGGTVLSGGSGTYTAPDPETFVVAATLLDEGANTIRVCLTPAGEPTGSSTTVITKDTQPPAAPTLTNAPASATSSRGATIGFTHLEPGMSYICALDLRAPAACTSPAVYAGLVDGAHTFSVYAIDAAGNAGSAAPAVVSWVVHASNPETTIKQAPPPHANTASVSFAFSSAATGATFECSLDGGAAGGPAFTPCTSPATYTGLVDDDHVFAVRAVDSLGKRDPTPAAWLWSVDTLVPETILLVAPSGKVDAREAVLEFAASEPGAGFQCKLDAGQYRPCTSPQVYTRLADGRHTVNVRAVDAAGNVDGTPIAASFDVDAPPETSIVAGPAGSIATSRAIFVLASTTPSDTFECSLDGAAYVPCASTHDVTNLAPGEHGLSARAVDLGGERDPTPARATWTVVSVAASPAAFASNVRKVRAKAGDHRVKLSWTRPKDASFKRVEIVRVPGKQKATRSLVYKGNKKSFIDRGLKNGVEYVWIVYAVDKKGNRSGGVKVRATAPVRARLGKKSIKVVPQTPIVMWWNPVKKANFYNLQLFRGQTKVLSSWPADPSVALKESWNWEGSKRTLKAGTYQWFVWPGFGKRADSDFGKLLGSGKIVVKKPAAPKRRRTSSSVFPARPTR